MMLGVWRKEYHEASRLFSTGRGLWIATGFP